MRKIDTSGWAVVVVLACALTSAVTAGAWWDDPFWRGISVFFGLTSVILGDHL